MKFLCDVALERPTGFRLALRFACTTEALAIVGPSGSGKSTLLDVLAGVQPAAGRVELDGESCLGVPLERRAVGWVTQDALLFPHLDVRANLSFSPRAGDVDEVVDALHLRPLLARMPRHLSGGERRRVALARALVSRPRLLLLDEPFAGLDAQARRDALSLLAAVQRRFRVPFVLVSHVTEEIVGVAQHALRLHDGRVQAEGQPAAVLRPGENAVDNHLVGRVIDTQTVEVDGCRLTASLPAGAAGDVRLACFAHDVLLARARPAGLSARNLLETEVATLQGPPVLGGPGDVVLVHLRRPTLVATVTRGALDELGLRPGCPVWAIVKATSLVCLGPA